MYGTHRSETHRARDVSFKRHDVQGTYRIKDTISLFGDTSVGNTRERILGRNPDKSHKSFPPCYSQSPFPMGSEIHTKVSFWELLRLCPETSTKLYVHEIGFSSRHRVLVYSILFYSILFYSILFYVVRSPGLFIHCNKLVQCPPFISEFFLREWRPLSV